MRKLTVKNFSVIKEAELDFGKITVLIGPQSSGKSLLCKLAYFLRFEVLAVGLNASRSGQSWESFQNSVAAKFSEWFPPEGWGNDQFFVHLQMDHYFIEIVGPTHDIQDQLLKLRTSDEFESTYLNLAKATIQQPLSLDSESAEAAAWGEFSRLQDATIMTSPLFIPAGRSFFTNANLGFAAMQNPGLDPLIRRFAAEIIWNSAKWKVGLLTSGRAVTELIGVMMDKIAGGSVIVRGSDPIFKTLDGRLLHLDLLSSGTQELLPLFNVLHRLAYLHEHEGVLFRTRQNGGISRKNVPIKPLVYLEEPETHIFPNWQYELVRLFSWLASDPYLDFDWVITTHSPYILSAFGNLLKAGKVGAQSAEHHAAVEKTIAEKYWIKNSDFAAYKIEDRVLESIFDQETGQIDGDYLDDVSSDIAEEFGQLLEIQYGG